MSTITVINKETNKEILIKESRFNEELHSKIGEDPETPTAPEAPVTPLEQPADPKEDNKETPTTNVDIGKLNANLGKTEDELSEKELEDIALLAKLQAEYVEKFKKDLPPRYKNDIEWIKDKLNS